MHKTHQNITRVNGYPRILYLFLSILIAIFPGGPGLPGTKMSPFRISLELRVMEVVVTTGAIDVQTFSQNVITKKPTPSFLLQAGCPSCRPANSVKALKGKLI